MAVEYVGTGNDDGVSLGRSATDKITFFNGTAVAQGTVTAVATGATAATIVTALQALQTELNRLNLILNA